MRIEFSCHQAHEAQAETFSRPDLIPLVEALLRRLVPEDHYGTCNQARQITVSRIVSVVNTVLWSKYILRRRQLVQALRQRDHCPWVSDLLLPAEEFAATFQEIDFEKGTNETLSMPRSCAIEQFTLTPAASAKGKTQLPPTPAPLKRPRLHNSVVAAPARPCVALSEECAICMEYMGRESARF